MKKINIKRIIASGLSLLTMATCLSAGSVAYAEDLVAINETNFADKNFRTILSQVYDKDSNGYLSTAEIESVTIGAAIDTSAQNKISLPVRVVILPVPFIPIQ